MDYLPIQEFSDRWDISKRRIQILCKEGRIEAAKMIGNMWVIPSDTLKPGDARIKNPIVAKSESISIVRRELKKLLKELFDKTEQYEIREEDKRNLVLTSIAYSLCDLYLKNTTKKKKVFEVLYSDISGKKEEIEPDNSMIECAGKFVEKFSEDSEVNNILSWSYQYSNKYIQKNIYSQTQFFTEKYMIDYLVKSMKNLQNAKKIVDPCAGGGNFLVECFEQLCDNQQCSDLKKCVIANSKKLYGYDIDRNIARIAVVNIRIRAMSILSRNGEGFDFNLWQKITPNIFMSKQNDSICGSLAKDNRLVINIVQNTELELNKAIGMADIILTNPPFATIKGMAKEQRDFLKQYYPDANCDTCVSFLDAVYGMLRKNGQCGIVSQNVWMHLKSFKNIRSKFTSQYTLHRIINLGSGAFLDLNGEKSNVALIVLEKNSTEDNTVEVMNLTALSSKEKIEKLKYANDYLRIRQNTLNGMNGYDFTEIGVLNAMGESEELYKDVAVPMQGTSTGNAKELVGFFWEHFGDENWAIVSNGGGYCRWQGLNDCVVKWGKEGEHIRAQKGSALRNVKYFSETQMVFSDTGTAGLNVRTLLKNQKFIASGPGIRIKRGSEYAHLALLNSRFASYYVRTMSPKLTIAAGYIGQIPINEKICSSVVLEKDAKLCVELKQKMLATRPNNIEYNSSFIEGVPSDLDNAAWQLFNEDITNELLKLELESKIDHYIIKEYGFSNKEEKQLVQSVGDCAYYIDDVRNIDLGKFDKYVSNLIDASCCLKRTRASKNSLGSDGILEYVAKDLGINPEFVVRKIQDNPFVMKNVLNKYKAMILHNSILYKMGYTTKNGVEKPMCSFYEVKEYLEGKFDDSVKYDQWIKKSFNIVHKEIFKGVPYLIYDKEVMHRYDYKVVE